MSFRRILSAKLNNEQKTILRNYYNTENAVNLSSISKISKRMGLSSNEAYESLRDIYNQDIEQKQQEKKTERKLNSGKQYYVNNIAVVNENDDLYSVLKRMLKKSLVITTYSEKGGNILSTRYETIPDTDKGFIDWWKSTGVWIIWKTSGETIYQDYPEAVIYVWEGDKKIKPEKIKQFFKEGNVNCLLKPIVAWAENCKEKAISNCAKSKYNAILGRLKIISNQVGDNGVSETEMIRITNDAQVDISIEKPIIVGDEKYVVESKSNKKALKHFIMRNTKLNHVDLNELLYLNNVEVVTRTQLYEIKKDLEEQGIYYEFKRDLQGYTSINTLEKTYKISNEFGEMINEMQKETGLDECYIDDIGDKDLSLFVKNGTHYNATIDFDMNRHGAKHIDMVNAYASYKNCEYYEGFLGKITDWRKTSVMEGVGLYQICDLVFSPSVQQLNDKMQIYFNNNIYPSCELKWLIANGCTFRITYGCWGVKPIDFDMNDYKFLFEKYDKDEHGKGGVKGYAKYVGMCDSHYLTKKFSCYGDESLASTLDNCVYFKNNEITIEYPKKHNYHLGHFTAFIVAYQRLQMLDQLMTMEYDNLIRVCVDGIYYRGDANIRIGFSHKTKMTFENIAGESYVSNIIDIIGESQEWDCGEYKVNNRLELYVGEGGNGKTHKNLIDKGLVRVLYLAPSWKLAEKKRQEYGCDKEVWANVLTDDPEKYAVLRRYYNVFVIDEVSMMTEENKQAIFKKFPNNKLIFCGDIGYQAPPFSIDGKPIQEITTSGFDIIYEEKNNYRYKCEKLKNIIATVRSMIRNKRPDHEINEYVKKMFVKKTNEEVAQLYSVEDMILSRTHAIKDEYTEMFKDMPKWYVTKNTRAFKNGQIIIGDKPDTVCELRHAYTIHSIQGETAENKLFINMTKRYDARLLYTAISRARRHEQIIIII